MKILFITPASYPNVFGGSEISVFYFAKELAFRGHDVFMITFDSQGITKEEKIENIRIKRYPAQRNLIMKIRIFIDMNLHIRENRFEIIHFYGLGVLPVSYLIKMIHNVKTVVTLNYYHNICHKKTVLNNGNVCTKCGLIELLNCSKSSIKTIHIMMYRLLSPIHDKYIVLSKNSIKLFKMCGFPDEKILIIPNIIFETREAHHKKKVANTILYTGQLSNNKGVDLLIMALSKIKNEINDIKCYIVGTGQEQPNLKKLAHKMGVEDYVSFVGFVSHDKLESYYLSSDLFVFPVRWIEPFGRSLLEAMNYGIPSVASDNIDSEVMGNAVKVFKSNDWNDLAEKILYLFSNPHEREILAKRGKIHVQNYYPNKIISNLENVYKNLLLE